MTRKAIVTGGAGFIGSHLVDRLLADGHSVEVVDSFATGQRANLAAHATHPSLRIHAVDVNDGAALDAIFAGADWVFHLAALADIVPSIERPLDYHRANVDGTVSVMEAVRRAGIRRVVYAASSSCYGIAETLPTPETAPIRPQYPYALTKHLGEQIALHWGAVYGIRVTALRLFNVYGPRSRTTGAYGAVFGVFLAQRLARKPMTVVGDGTQTRDFTFVTDVVEAFMTAAAADGVEGVFNVGSGGSYSVNRLVELLGGSPTYIPKRPGEPDVTFADTRQIASLLGWTPRVSFEDGVGLMLSNIDLWRDAPLWDPASIEEATREWFRCLDREGRTR